MARKGSVPRKRRPTTRAKTKQQARTKPLTGRTARRKRVSSASQEEQRSRIFDALNLYRQGKAKSVSTASRHAGTSLKKLWELAPRAIGKDRRTGRLHIKATDPYSAKVQILTDGGAVTASARGSRQRELAGRHRATVMR